jgi:stage II sporulation protein AA (anti-sigma F factor antagonist)
MKISIRESVGGLVIGLSGELDHHAAKKILREINDCTDEIVPTVCILDMSGVTFMDSSGIAVALGLYRKMNEVGGKMSVRGASPQAMKIFGAAGLERMIKFE